MMFRKKRFRFTSTSWKIGLLFAGVLLSINTKATHISGGHISYREIEANTYEFTFTGYRDVEGVLFGNGVFDFGDGTSFGGPDGDVIPWENPLATENGYEIWSFTVIHSYSSLGTYFVSYVEEFRNADIQNIEGSVSTSFYVEASLVIDPLLGPNSSPVFSVPNFRGQVGQDYLASFDASDPDGDSLAYRWVVPKQFAELDVSSYRLPNDPSFYSESPGRFGVSSRTGNLVWETDFLDIIPAREGREFSVAIMVEQWRNGFRVGTNIIDYNVTIFNFPEIEPVELLVPSPICYHEEDLLLEDGITFINPGAAAISVSFQSSDPAFKIDGMSIEEWNESSLATFSNDEVSIAVTFDPEKSSPVLSFSTLRMNFLYTLRIAGSNDILITQSQSLWVGKNCARVLGTPNTLDQTMMILKDQIRFEGDHKYTKAVISDLSGRTFLEADIKGIKTISYSFEKNIVYLLTFVSDEKIVTKKFLIK